VAAVNALDDPDYYARRYRQTNTLCSRLVDELSALGQMQLVPGVANFVLCHLDPDAPEAATVLQRCQEYNVFLRDASTTAPALGKRALRIAVKDSETNGRMVEVLRKALTADVPLHPDVSRGPA
jgi:histidinol-phosphate/aromatic aminotransferase/cobyric acid decarboxylase-like protein